MSELLEPTEEAAKPKKPKKVEPLTEEEFFSLTDLRQRKATIRVKVIGKKRYNESNGKLDVMTADKEIVVAPAYWESLHRTYKNADDMVGEPTDLQELVGYTLDGVYSEFKK